MTRAGPVNRSDKFALATVLPLLALSALMQVLAQGNSDKSWLLLAARMWLAGKRLYVDIVEVNPPLIVWFYAIPVRLSGYIHALSDYQLLGLMGVIASAACIFLCVRLIRLHPEFAGNARKRTEFALMLAALFVFLIPQADFADREHLIYLLTFPYVLRLMPSLARAHVPLRLRIATGLLAAFGFCIKPHTLILFLGAQGIYLWRERSPAMLVSLENNIIYCGVAVYLFCVWQFAPEYVHLILPMALETYSSFSRGGSPLLCLPPAILCAALIFPEFRLRYRSPYREDVLYYIGIAVVFFLYAMAGNGWDYTYQPLISTLTLLAGLVLYEYQWLRAHDASATSFVFGMRGCAICLATQGIYMALITFTSVGVATVQARCYWNIECLRQDPYTRYVHDNHISSFGTITQDFPKWVQLVRFTGAAWETRFNHLWMMPKLLTETSLPEEAQHPWIKAYVADALAEDLARHAPEIVFVDAGRQMAIYPKHIDLVEYLSAEPAFKAAWSRYHYSATIDECNLPRAAIFKNACKYDIYSRVTP